MIVDDDLWKEFIESDSPTAAIDYVNRLFGFHVLIFRNEDPDCREIYCNNHYEMLNVVKTYFVDDKDVVQMIVPNPSKDCLCPYVMMMLEAHKIKTPTNYKLETFMRNMGMTGIHPGCSVALVVGMMNPMFMDSLMDIPNFYRMCSLSCFDKVGQIELSIESSVAVKITKESGYEYPGMILPYDIPDELAFKILSYLQHPCAEAISTYKRNVLRWISYWDNHFHDMFCSWERRSIW